MIIISMIFTSHCIIFLLFAAMESAEREVVQFSKTITPADARGLVEKWLLQVELQTNLRTDSGKKPNAAKMKS